LMKAGSTAPATRIRAAVEPAANRPGRRSSIESWWEPDQACAWPRGTWRRCRVRRTWGSAVPGGLPGAQAVPTAGQGRRANAPLSSAEPRAGPRTLPAP
jgi:hypothetical protein